MRVKMNKKNVYDIMNNAGKWTDLSYCATIGCIEVSAVIPQKKLKKGGIIPKAIVELLRKPCLLSKRRLLVFFGIHVDYRLLPPASDALAVA